MSSQWQDLRWGDIGTLEYGRGLRGYDDAQGLYRVYGTNGPIGWAASPLSQQATVVVGRKGAYRGVHYSPKPCYVIDTAFYLVPKTDFDMRWAYYQLLTQDINSMDSGSAIPSTSRDAFYHLPVKLPPLPEQRAIAHILGTLDDKIELNRRLNQTLEEIARALFTSWFVTFDPVRAKAEGRQPAGMDAETAALFPAILRDSGVGQLPEGWEIGSIRTHARLLSGGTPRTQEPAFWDGNVPWASAKDVSQSAGIFLVDSERSITQRGLNESSTQLVPTLATVVVARGATTGRMVLFGQEMAMNQTCYALVSTAGTPFTLFLQLGSAIGEMVQSAHGSVFDTITTATFVSSAVILPPLGILQAFERVVAPLFKRMLANSTESRVLGETRDTLFPRLLSGELSVASIDRLLEERA